MNYHLTIKSANIKTGKIAVSTSSAKTCPPSCPLIRKCYAASGPLELHWRKVTRGERGSAWRDFLDGIRKLPDGSPWRHNQAGDLAGRGDRINRRKLEELATAARHTRGWTYTHKPVLGISKTTSRNRWAIAAAMRRGFAINLSANDLGNADALASLDLAPVVVLLPENSPETVHTPAGRKVIVCPAQSRQGVTCSTCQLCAVKTRSVIVGFRAHGSRKKLAEAVACGK